MDHDTKEEEPLLNGRNRRVAAQYESATLQLQELLEKVKQIKINSNIPNELFINTISEFMQSLNDNNANIIKCKQDTQDTQATALTDSYNNALQIISQKETELQLAHLAYQAMAMQLATYKQKYRIDAVLSNADHKEQQITDVNRGNADEILTGHTEEKIDNTANQRMDAYEVESDCSSSSSSSSDCGLLTNDVTFKPVGEYEPVSFNKYIFYNPSMNVNDEYDGIQSDWQCTANGDLSQDETDEDEDEDEEDECIHFIKALNTLQIKCDGLQNENEMLRDDNRQKLQMVQDIGIKYKNKCLECDRLKRKLSNND